MATKASPEVTGFSTHERLFASQFRQGGRTVYQLDLSPLQLISLITRPNPDVPVESNRQIRPTHAKGFADYFREQDDWVIPGIILRTPTKFDFEVRDEISGTKFGVLSISRTQAREINILDGQHRILGFFMAADDIAVDMDRARGNLAKARRQDPGGAAERVPLAEIETLQRQLEKLEKERLSIQLFVEEDPKAYRQMFFDISDNALGITASVRARFDSRSVVNRALPDILDHPLLKGRVELEVDRVRRGSEHLLSAKNVAEICRCVIVGFNGRVSRRMQEELKEEWVAAETRTFLDGLAEAFPPLRAVQLGQIAVSHLRANSLLGSASFLRMLAGLYYELQLPLEHGWKRDQVLDFFMKLAPHAVNEGSPVYPGSIWLDHMPEGSFFPGELAPIGRREALTQTYEALLEWALDKPAFLDELPAPKPEREPEFTEEAHLLAKEELAEMRERK